ncbi:protein MAIN-LIKE 1-like [Papaver somniferum]|uniref:protein MAIN-LIKE 1-like n=1 Tax=Papaver somniferum TaxID=3469 RepID=UPI000E700331|nr:protein MAIN-LIKE 1-like [Papaver somniferum]
MHGLPADGGKVLIGYEESWANKIYETPDHRTAIRNLRHQRAAAWDLKNEVVEVQAIVQKSDLWKAIEYEHKDCDSAAAYAFDERFCPETYTFHLPFGEMTITSDDAEKIIRLRARGRSVNAEYSELDWDQLYKLAEEVLGWDHTNTLTEFCNAAKEVDNVQIGGSNKPKMLKSFKMKRLKEKFENTQEKVSSGTLVMDEAKINQTVAAYLLYTLGRIIFPDHSGNKVTAQYLQFLKDLSKVSEYAWGTSCAAYLLQSLATASRCDPRNIGGNFSLLQVWIYDHFPKLKLSTPIEVVDETLPTSAKYEFKDHKKKDKPEKLINLREKLESLDGTDVVFDPCVQTLPLGHTQKFKLFPKGSKGTNSTSSSWEPKYEPELSLDHWKHLEDSILSWDELQTLHQDPREVVEGYMDWYSKISHPLIIDRVSLAQVEAEMAKAKAKEVAEEAKGAKKSDNVIHDASDAVAMMHWQAIGSKKRAKRTRLEPGGPSGGGDDNEGGSGGQRGHGTTKRGRGGGR